MKTDLQATATQITGLDSTSIRISRSRWETWLYYSCALILALFGAAKLYSSSGTATILLVPDPVFGIQYRQLLGIAGISEIFLSGALAFAPSRQGTEWALGLGLFCLAAWLYRIALHFIGVQEFCPCLGTVAAKLGITDGMAARISAGVLSYLTVCAGIALSGRWISNRSRQGLKPQIALTAAILACANVTEAASGYMPREGIRLEGKISWKGTTPGSHRMDTTHESRFSVLLSGCTYNIEEFDRRNGFLKQSVSYDLTNWYCVITFDPDAPPPTPMRMTANGPEPIPDAKVKKTINPETVTVSPRIEEFLPKITSLLPLWLAFGSGCYFATNTDPDVSPLYYMGDGRLHRAQRVKADRSVSNDGRFLTAYADYWDEGLFSLPGCNCSGLKHIEFHVTGWTNVGGLNVPLGFSFRRHYVSMSPQPEYWQSMEALGVIEKIEARARSESNSLALAKNSWVIHQPAGDSQTRVDPISYLARDGRLKSQKEVNALAGARDAIGTKPPPPATTKYFFRGAILITVLSIPLVFLLRKMSAKGG